MHHGHIELNWRDAILLIQVFGPFNLPGIKQAFADIRDSVSQKPNEHWYRLEVLDQNTLGSPEVMKVIGASYIWSIEQGCQFIAVVCANRIQQTILQEFIRTSGLNIMAFNSQAEAETHILQLQESS